MMIEGWNTQNEKADAGRKCYVKAVIVSKATVQEDGSWQLHTDEMRGDIYEWKYVEESVAESQDEIVVPELITEVSNENNELQASG